MGSQLCFHLSSPAHWQMGGGRALRLFAPSLSINPTSTARDTNMARSTISSMTPAYRTAVIGASCTTVGGAVFAHLVVGVEADAEITAAAHAFAVHAALPAAWDCTVAQLPAAESTTQFCKNRTQQSQTDALRKVLAAVHRVLRLKHKAFGLACKLRAGKRGRSQCPCFAPISSAHTAFDCMPSMPAH